MATPILTITGAVVGSIFGGPVGGTIGASIGGTLGSYIDQSLFAETLIAPSLADLAVQTSAYGKMLPIVHGYMRLGGNVIWSTKELKEVSTNETVGGKGGGGQDVVNKSYYVTLAIAICAGEIDNVVRAWADAKPLTFEDIGEDAGKYEIYKGTETQNPSPIIESYEGVGNVPAYRGVAYVVIEDFPLADYGNRIPNFTFEVKRTLKDPTKPRLEDKVTAITLIPGSGEFVYSTDIIEKHKVSIVDDIFPLVEISPKVPMNMHNFQNVPNVQLAVDDMLETFPNLEWVSLVVNWFITSKHMDICEIIPKMEYPYEELDESGEGDIIRTIFEPYDWSVGSYNRTNASTVLKNSSGAITYGGTPSDKSIIDLCVYLKSKGLKIMFYPMPLVDTLTEIDEDEDDKPWRGRLVPASSAEVTRFFTGDGGYNDFIRHYSDLTVGGVHLKDNIDAFVIGSELVGITTYSDSLGSFPAVDELVDLAALVRSDLGAGVDITYAADWTEYHSVDGWYHLDPLWEDANIDFVGIDAYFPITEDLPQNLITYSKIKEFWEKGEGWNYFWNEDRTVKTNYSGATYAWKNVEHWWNSTHINPDSNPTGWTPKLKPVIFTEGGFPSVDGCANQPNVFYAPDSVESFFPRASLGNPDYIAQYTALEATIDYLQERNAETGKAGLVPLFFIWAWDARPYPYFPQLMDVWADGDAYIYGHWVQGKVGNATLDRVIIDILTASGELTDADIDVTELERIQVQGHVISNQSSIRSILEKLIIAYQFLLIESDGKIKAVRLGKDSVVTLTNHEVLVIEQDNRYVDINITRTDDTVLPNKITVNALSRERDYNTSTQIAVRQTVQSKSIKSLDLGVVLSDFSIKQIADIILYRSWAEREQYVFGLSSQYGYLEPSDVITLNRNGTEIRLRLTSVQVGRNLETEITAVSDDKAVFEFVLFPAIVLPSQAKGKILGNTKLECLDLPALPQDTTTEGVLRFAMCGLSEGWKGAVLYQSLDGGVSGGNVFNQIGRVDSSHALGGVINLIEEGTPYYFDNTNKILVGLINGTLSSVTEFALLNGANTGLFGNEIIQFQNAELIGENKYRLTKLLRGRFGTEHEIGNHTIGERFVFLQNNLLVTTRSPASFGQTRHYKPVTIGKTLADTTEKVFTYTGKTLRPYSPVDIEGTRDGSGNLTITFKRRTRLEGEWRDKVDVPLAEESEKYEIDILDGSDVVRTLYTTVQQATYTDSQQVTDFGSLQSTVSLKIYQISSIFGRGVAGMKEV